MARLVAYVVTKVLQQTLQKHFFSDIPLFVFLDINTILKSTFFGIKISFWLIFTNMNMSHFYYMVNVVIQDKTMASF